MRKASAIVLYNAQTKQVYNLTIKHKGDLIPMVIDGTKDRTQPYCYESFTELYQAILNVAKHNGFYYDSYSAFGANWYDISWIDINNPVTIAKYGFRKAGV